LICLRFALRANLCPARLAPLWQRHVFAVKKFLFTISDLELLAAVALDAVSRVRDFHSESILVVHFSFFLIINFSIPAGLEPSTPAGWNN